MAFRSDENFLIRSAHDGDFRAIRMLLSGAVHFGSGAILAAAVADGLLIGAAALDPLVRTKPFPGQRFIPHVIAPWRPRGVGQALVQWGDQAAAARGSRALYAWSSVEPNGDAALAWQRLGFDYSQPRPQTRISVRKTVEYLQTAQQRVIRRFPPPAGARVIPIRQMTVAQRKQAIALHLANLGGDQATVEAQLAEDSPNACDGDLSHVLLVDEAVMGLALVRRASGNVCLIESDVLDPRVRRSGWANLLLKWVPAVACRNAGIETFIFDTFQQHIDSRRFAQKAGGVTVKMIEPYRLILRPERSIADDGHEGGIPGRP